MTDGEGNPQEMAAREAVSQACQLTEALAMLIAEYEEEITEAETALASVNTRLNAVYGDMAPGDQAAADGHTTSAGNDLITAQAKQAAATALLQLAQARQAEAQAQLAQEDWAAAQQKAEDSIIESDSAGEAVEEGRAKVLAAVSATASADATIMPYEMPLAA